MLEIKYLLPPVLLFCGCLHPAACSEANIRAVPPSAGAAEQTDGSVSNQFVTIYQVDPLIKLIPESGRFPAGNDTLRTARGETATLQLVLDAKSALTETSAELVSLTGPAGATLSGSTCGWVRYVRSTLIYAPAADDNIVSPSQRYPDPIIDDQTENIAAGEHRSLWIGIPIPETTATGLYKGVVRIDARSGNKPVSIEKSFHLQVYPVNVGEPKLLLTNWQFEYFDQMNRGEAVETGSALYFELKKELARTCKSLGQNTYRIEPSRIPVGFNPDGSWQFDFSAFDREVEFYLEHGGLKCIEANPLCIVLGGKVGTEFGLQGGYEPDGNGGFKRMSAWGYDRENPDDAARVRAYLGNYMAALRKHLIEKGWLDTFVQHIGDEPTETNYDSWLFYARIVKEYFPDIRLMDAIEEGAVHYLDAVCDIMTPKLDILHQEQNLFAARRAAGKKDWFYTCMFPMGDYANRFVNLPLLKTRILHWLNYKSGTVGYLHWGLMFWHENLWQDIYQDCSNPPSYLPGGDSYLLYPGYRKLYLSIRAHAMRDGVHDYNLLKMVEERDPAKAEAFLNAIVPDYDRYDMNVPHFRQTRKEMLEYLSQN